MFCCGLYRTRQYENISDWQLGRTAWTYITTGTLRRLMWMHKGPVIAALYPVGMLLLQLLVAIVLGGLLTSMGK